MTMQNPYPPNPQPELARERNRIAADRSLLSFIRSSVTLISIGVGINQVSSIFVPIVSYLGYWTYLLSVLMVGVGVITLIFAARDYQGELQRLQQPEYYFTPRWSLGGVTGWIILVAGSLTFLRLLLTPVY
jgi:putative membrane protein